jgi:hypothetical protein
VIVSFEPNLEKQPLGKGSGNWGKICFSIVQVSLCTDQLDRGFQICKELNSEIAMSSRRGSCSREMIESDYRMLANPKVSRMKYSCGMCTMEFVKKGNLHNHVQNKHWEKKQTNHIPLRETDRTVLPNAVNIMCLR